MKSRSAKAKGKRAVFEVRDRLLEAAPELRAEDVVKPVGSRPGADLILSERAKALFPFAIEVKNQEKLNIWEALEQAERHGKDENLPGLLVFKRNHSETYVSLRLDEFLKILRKKDVET